MASLDTTPTKVLQKEISYYKNFIHILTTKDGIDQTVEQSKIDGLIAQCEKQITLFEEAIKKLE